ncbi:hypothetical protein QR680_001908 [Steinernema hermaphroditum]|uniref:DM13 domain-containing protein n=1 Tax=Steinernema hermaphroditum TaxID=289476 RepID=A0AA39H373_9BILA|nr:hypothetical protein QR680_001908 [Steinernema hermaphroditum]
MTPCRTKYTFKMLRFLTLLITTTAFRSASGNPQSNYIAPLISGHQTQGKVIPWSEYRQLIKEKNESPEVDSEGPFSKADKRSDPILLSSKKKFIPYRSSPTNANSMRTAFDNINNSSKPITIYLPPFKTTKLQRKSKLLTGHKGQNFESNDHTPPIGETNRILHQQFKLNKPLTQAVPQRPIPATNYTTDTISILTSPVVAGVPQYSRLGASPIAPSFNGPSTNLVDSIFAQSQVRHSPPTFDGLSSLSSVQGTATQNGNALQSILSNGPTINQLSNLAKNLLALPGGNQELLSTVTNALAGISKPAKLTSTAVLPGVSETSVSTDVATPQRAAGSPLVQSPDTFDLSGFGNAERDILEAAVKNGEVDRNSLMELAKDKQSTIKHNSNKLMEWIQQNRPSVSEKDSTQASLIASEQLPYYGSYCGGFSSQNNTKFNVNGALWAVDDRRFIVSKFHFRPGSMTENITFWAGPKVIADDMIADIFPSDNGFYIRPEPIDFTVFTVKPIIIINATVRGSKLASTSTSSTISQNGTTNEVSRKARDIFRDIYEKPSNLIEDSKTVHLSVKGGIVTPMEGVEEQQTNADLSKGNTSLVKSDQTFGTTVLPDSSNAIIHDTLSPSASHATSEAASSPTPLEWYEGFQPLLLTLPDDKWIKTTYWMALRNHKKKSTVAAVLIPNGPAFKIPAPVQLNPFNTNPLHSLSSGTIKLLDIKTIEVTDFCFSANGVAAWFMVGKDIGPNSSGHIVPIFDRNSKSFDCESLRDYRNETVTLRLPGTLTIKDVFWLSVYSPPRLLDLSKQYVPYKDINLPPDLQGTATPRCVLP